MKYRVGNIESNSKSAIQKKAKEILYDGELNSILNENEYSFMTEYFHQFHLEWIFKKGVGIKSIKRVKEPLYGKHRAFWIERIDGTSTDISYIISNIQKKDYHREFHNAMRQVIVPQIRKFKKSEFKNSKELICPLTKEIVTIQNSHVDHDNPTFKELIDTFITKHKIVITKDLFPPERDNQSRYSILDSKIETKFYKFHQENASLRITSSTGNLRRTK